jgi:WD40 repeat protein
MFVFGIHEGGLNTNCLAYSPDGALLVSAKSGVKVWDFATRQLLQEIPTQGDASSVDFSPNGSIVVANGSRNAPVQVFNPHTGELIEEYPGSCKIQCAHYAEGGKTLVMAGHSHAAGLHYEKIYPIVRYSVETRRKKKPLLGHTEEVGFLAFSHDGRMMASGNCKGEAILWNVKSRQPLQVMTHRALNWRIVAFSPDDDLLAITAGNSIELWNTKKIKRRKILRGHTAIVHGIRFTPSGRTLISVSEDGSIRHWDRFSFRETVCFDWKMGPMNNLAISPDGLTASAGSIQGEILVWDIDAA